ncbi:hypothetical protein JXA40_01640 [bacterium]|nr:hypothetical protein [candidate division CSSED10-310 bacterium]
MKIELEVPRKTADLLANLSDHLGISPSDLLARLLESNSENILPFRKLQVQQIHAGDMIDLKKVGIYGIQAVSRGLIKLFAEKGVSVVIVGESDEQLKMTMDMIKLNMDWMITKWELTETEKLLVLQHIQMTTDLQDLSDVDLLFDTVQGHWEERQRIYREINGIIPENIIVALHDDTCPVSQFAEYFTNPSRVIGFHLTYPPSRRHIVEIMRGRKTSDDTVIKMLAIARFLKKEVIEVMESSGTISTRIIMQLINESIGLWAEGVATAKEIDKVLKLALDLKMGPLEYADTYGLDTVLETLESLHLSHGLLQFRPQARLKNLVSMGYLGKKTGHGIHLYENSQIGEAP